MTHYGGQASDGQRAMHLQKKREREQEELELRKRKLEDTLKVNKIESKFSAHYDAVEVDLKSSTVGLLTVEEMVSRQQSAVQEREKLLARKNLEEEKKRRREKEKKDKVKQKQSKQIKALSFNMDEDEEEEEDDKEDNDDEGVKGGEETKTSKGTETENKTKESKEEEGESSSKRKRFGKNPNVDTHFLPDVDRDEEENQLRERLRQEWEEKQLRLKEEEIEITYSYWDGSGHRRTMQMKKGQTIYQFLQKCLEDLRKDFTELRTVTADQLMYVKEDLIIPQTNTFYDFIVTKARGKSGPLFSFDVKDDIRLINDATVEKEESHAGKVVLRSWYERNKHIFPASRWEPYDPTKSYDQYTYHDKKGKK